MKKYFSIPILISLAVIVPACATTRDKAIEFTCANKDKIIQAAETTIKLIQNACPITKGTE